MVAKPLPPKHTSMRQSMDGMAHLLPVSRCFFALHTDLAPSSFSAGQSLMFGRFATMTGVFVWKSICAGSTPVFPTRALTWMRSSSVGTPLKFPQCPSWSGCLCMLFEELTRHGSLAPIKNSFETLEVLLAQSAIEEMRV